MNAKNITNQSMAKVWREEIRMLTAASRKIIRDYKIYRQDCFKEMRRLRAIERQFNRAHRDCDAELQRIEKRKAILVGRLNH